MQIGFDQIQMQFLSVMLTLIYSALRSSPAILLAEWAKQLMATPPPITTLVRIVWSADQTFADIKVLSFYLNDEIALTDSLDLVLGARFDNMDIGVSGTTTGSDEDDTISPRIKLIFDLTEEATVYASFSETFAPKAGDQYAKVSANDDKIDPDTFENLEFGLRYDLPMGLSF